MLTRQCTFLFGIKFVVFGSRRDLLKLDPWLLELSRTFFCHNDVTCRLVQDKTILVAV